jgi:hypothetical protein
MCFAFHRTHPSLSVRLSILTVSLARTRHRLVHDVVATALRVPAQETRCLSHAASVLRLQVFVPKQWRVYGRPAGREISAPRFARPSNGLLRADGPLRAGRASPPEVLGDCISSSSRPQIGGSNGHTRLRRGLFVQAAQHSHLPTVGRYSVSIQRNSPEAYRGWRLMCISIVVQRI